VQPQERQHSDGGAGTRDRLQPRDRLIRQPQECQHSAADIRRDTGPTASGEGLNKLVGMLSPPEFPPWQKGTANAKLSKIDTV